MDSGALSHNIFQVPWRYVVPDEKHSLRDSRLYFALFTICYEYFTQHCFFLNYLDPYLSFPLSDQLTKLVNAEKIRKQIHFVPQATISSKLAPKKIRAPDWLIASTVMQFDACPTSSVYCQPAQRPKSFLPAGRAKRLSLCAKERQRANNNHVRKKKKTN